MAVLGEPHSSSGHQNHIEIFRNLIQSGRFREAESMTRQACDILENCLADDDHMGYSTDYIRLSISDM